MRIVSLSPAATEWVRIFGAAGELEVISERDGVLGDAAWLGQSAPDLIITDVPPSWSEREANLTSRERNLVDIVVFAPTTLKQVLDGALRIGQAIGRGDAAMHWIASAEARLQSIRQRLLLHRRLDEAVLPSVVVLHQSDPPIVAGYWVPDMVTLAGGKSLFAAKGRPPEEVSWDAILAADPDIIVLASVGTDTGEHDRVNYVDGTGWLDIAGPRIYRGIGALAAICAAGKAGKP